jgi:hypothetical protein
LGWFVGGHAGKLAGAPGKVLPKKQNPRGFRREDFACDSQPPDIGPGTLFEGFEQERI